MNERIRELREQAMEWVPNIADPDTKIRLLNAEKFAELIVAEMCQHITDQQDLVETNWQCKDGIHIVYSLKEHFGVEE